MKFKKYYLLLGIIGIGGVFAFDDINLSLIEITPTFKHNNALTAYIATDLHYLSNALKDNGEAFNNYVSSGYGMQTKYSDELISTLQMDIKENKPEVLIISGDLTSNGEYQSHVDLAARLKEIEDMGTSIYVIPGNHDLNNPHAQGFSGNQAQRVDSISPEKFVNLYEDFGYNEAISKDDDTLSYLVAPQEKLWFMMLDTTKSHQNYKEGKPEVDGDVSFESWEWMRDCFELAKQRKATIIPVMHHSIVNHSTFFKNEFTLKNNKQVAELIATLGSQVTLTGHIHNQDISSMEVKGSKLFDIATNSLAAFPNQYGILQFSQEDGYHYRTQELNVEAWAKLNGITNPDLLNFETYSKELFGQSVYEKLKVDFEKKGYSAEETSQLLNVLQIVNIHYSAGRENEITESIQKEKGFELWSQLNGFWKEFLMTAIKDDNEDDNELILPIK